MKPIIGLTIASLLAPTSATASQSEWQDESQATARKVLRDFAECSVRYEPEVARRFIMMNDGERLPDADYRALFGGRCLGFRGGRLTMRSWRSRSALAEAFIRRQSKSRRPVSFSDVAALEWPIALQQQPGAKVDAAVIARDGEAVVAERLVSMLGECVVRADPSGVLSVLDSNIDSSKEAAQFRSLTPHIAGCVKKGETLAFNRTNLRNGLALSYFRLAAKRTATVQPSAGGNR